MDKIKVLHVINTLGMGGAEELILDICKNINKDRFIIEVAVLESQIYPVGDELISLGIKVHLLNCNHSYLDIRKVFKLFRVIKKTKPDIIHSHLFDANLYSRVAGIIARIPILIIHEHNTFHEKEKYFRLPVYADQLLSKYTYKIITISKAVDEFTKKQEKIESSKFVLIKNCIDTGKFIIQDGKSQSTLVRQELSIKESEFMIICVAGFRKQKGHKYLIEAINGLSNKDIKLILVGDGALRADIEKQVKKLGLKSKVQFLGIRRDIPELLNASDLFVLPSLWEGQGLVVIEAMASGLPVVATRVGGIPEFITNNEGYLVETGNVDSLINGISYTIEGIRMNKFDKDEIRLKAQRNFDIKIYIKEIEKLYFEAMELE